MENKPFDVKANKERLQKLHMLIIETGMMKLEIHRDKGDWLDNPAKRDPAYLMSGLIHEVAELQKEITKGSKLAYVGCEIGDIFNYLVMILETSIIKEKRGDIQEKEVSRT